jgi:hypothetical protein
MGRATGAVGGLNVRRTAGTSSSSDPRSRLQVHGRLRCPIRGRRHRIVRTPVQVPEANGIAERFVRTARSEFLDWFLISSTRHL